MALSLVLNIVVICAIGIGMAVLRLFNWIWLKPKKIEKSLREQGLNGNSYRFLFGDLKDMVRMSSQAKLKPINVSDCIVPRVMPFIYNFAKIHGKNFFTWMGPVPMVHITEPALIREILGSNYVFQKPKRLPPQKFLLSGLAFIDGDQWTKHRKIMRSPAFYVEKLKVMLPEFYISCCEMINKWEEIMNGRACEVDVFPHLQTFTSDVISRTAFGSSYEEGRKIFELQREQAGLVIKSSQSMYIPGSIYLPTKINRRMKDIDREVNSSITNIINKRVVAMKAGENSKDDLLGMLLASNDNEIKNHGDKSFGLTINQVIEECKLFYFGGQETVANFLTWTLILLAQHTYWQDRARDEVLQVFGKTKPDIDGLTGLKVINMIFHEVLRLYPPGIAIGRMIHEETRVGNIILPAGSQIQLHMMLLHYDNDIWGNDVNEFKPERFAEGVLKATKGQTSYFPFGGGPRICIGQNFAMLEAKLALAMILQRFSFKISPSYAHAPCTIITLQPQFGAQLILCAL